MKVLFVTRKWPPAVGGMETYSLELTKALQSKVDLDVLALAGRQGGDPPSLASVLWFFIKCSYFILRKSNQYQIIHIGDFVLAPLGLLAKLRNKKVKVAIMIHGLDILYGNRKGVLPTIYRWFQTAMTKFRCADYFIANSSNTGSLCEQAKLLPVKVIPLGVNVDLSSVDLKAHDNTILFLGRLVTRKGARWFAENVLPQLNPDIRFLVVGKTWDASEHEGLKNNSRVDLVGYASDEHLSLLLSKCIVAVMPNQMSKNQVDVEGFGLVAAELSVRGIPLIASNIEGLTSAVVNNQTGFLVQHDDIDSWVNKIREIALWDNATRQNYSLSCRNVAIEYYNWSRVASETRDLYQFLLEDKATD